MNRVTLYGALGADPEIRNTNGGKVASLRLATEERWKDKSGEKKTRTEWHRVVVWGDGLCGVLEKYVRKGSKLIVEGKLQTRSWEDQQGQKRYSTEVVVSGFGGGITLAGDPKGKSDDAAPKRTTVDDMDQFRDSFGGGYGKPSGAPDDDFHDDIPFAPSVLG